jgi:lysophospholipase L1-like esterase
MRYLFLLFLYLPILGNSQNFESSNKKIFLALGDSYTIGESVVEDERWPVQLVNRINKQTQQFDSPKIIAKTGWTTDELKAAVLKSNITQKYDYVSLLIGVNNQYRGRSVKNFEKEFNDLLNMAISFSKTGKEKVFVVSIPDWGVTPYAKNRDTKKISSEIDSFNATQKMVCEKLGVIFINITDISRIPDSKLIAEDGLHPSGLMYAQWIERIIPFLTK